MKNNSGSLFRKGKKKALGKGLDALIPGIASIEEEPSGNEEFFLCDVDQIEPNPYQPRVRFSEEELTQLADSIREQGVLQPLLVRPSDGRYQLIAGERRLRAAKIAGLLQVPVIIKDIADERMLEMSLVENIQRENLNPIEEAEAYHRLVTELNLTQEQVADRVGKSRSAVTNFLRLRQLPDMIKDTIIDGTLSMGHARALLGAENAAQQKEAWRQVMRKGLSVRETEALIKRMKSHKALPEKPPLTSEDMYFIDLAEDLSRKFGTRVQIKRRGKKGKLEIDFYSNEDLERLLQLIAADDHSEW